MMAKLRIAHADDIGSDQQWIMQEWFLIALALQELQDEFELVPYRIPEPQMQTILAEMGESSWPTEMHGQLSRVIVRLMKEAAAAQEATRADFGASVFVGIDLLGKDDDLGIALIADQHGRKYSGTFPVTEAVGKEHMYIHRGVGKTSTLHSNSEVVSSALLALPNLVEGDVIVAAIRCALESLRPKTPAIT